MRSLRRGNRDRLLGLLRDHGALHRAELARRAGLSRTTVSTIVSELLDEALVVEADESRPDQGGRRVGAVSLNPRAGVALGLDVSLTKVRAVVADLGHEVLADGVADLTEDLGWSERLDVSARLAEHLLTGIGLDVDRVVGAGIGVPGPVDRRTGQVAASSNSTVWEGVAAGLEFSRRLHVPVALDNTSHLGSLAEVVWGAGRGCRDVLYLKLATGIGAGLLIDGRVYGGAVGAAGEFGHLTVDESGPVCRCGNRGCLEVYASVPAVLDALRRSHGDLSLDQAIALGRAGDRACGRILADTGRLLGRAVAGVCNLLNPELVVVGGDLAGAGDLLLDPLRASVEQHALAIIAGGLRILPGELGDRAGALGGVALVLREAERLTPAPLP